MSVTALACTLALATACTSEGERPDEPTAAETAAVLADAAAATDSQDAARTLPALVETVADWKGPLPPELAAAVLDAFAAHPDELRSAATPNMVEVGTPVVGLDDALEALTAAGDDDDAAAEFRSAYLAYVRTGLEQAIRAMSDEPWHVVYQAIERAWVDPTAEVVGAVEGGCQRAGCYERLREAETESRDAVEAATYAAIPIELLPTSFADGGTKVPMAEWTTSQRDDWTRLRSTISFPTTDTMVKSASYRWAAKAAYKAKRQERVSRDTS